MSQTQQPIPMIERETSNTTDPEYKWELLPDDYTKYDLSFKLIVIGDSGVGKSCLTNKATKNIFEESYYYILAEERQKRAPGMVRTSDLQVNSLALYLLSYEGLREFLYT